MARGDARVGGLAPVRGVAGALVLAGALPLAGAAGSPAPAAAPAAAASTTAPAPLTAFADASDAACRQLVVPPLLARPDFAPVLAARPIGVEDVCRCVHDAVQGDPRLAPAFAGDAAAVDARMRSPELKGYLSMRVVSAALACTAQEMDRSLASAPVPHGP